MEKKIFLAMAGNIGCGKTTAAKLISQKFGFELFDEPVIDNRFLKSYYADMDRWSFTLQMEFLMKLMIVEEHTRTKITPRDMARELVRLLVTARVEHKPSIMRKLALFVQNPS